MLRYWAQRHFQHVNMFDTRVIIGGLRKDDAGGTRMSGRASQPPDTTRRRLSFWPRVVQSAKVRQPCIIIADDAQKASKASLLASVVFCEGSAASQRIVTNY